MRNYLRWQRILPGTFRLMAVLAGIIMLAPAISRAQQANVTVPDLTGLSAPQAAKALATAGLIFGGETDQAWSADAKVKTDQVSSQQPAPGDSVAAASPVQVTVLRTFNARLIF